MSMPGEGGGGATHEGCRGGVREGLLGSVFHDESLGDGMACRVFEILNGVISLEISSTKLCFRLKIRHLVTDVQPSVVVCNFDASDY